MEIVFPVAFPFLCNLILLEKTGNTEPLSWGPGESWHSKIVHKGKNEVSGTMFIQEA